VSSTKCARQINYEGLLRRDFPLDRPLDIASVGGGVDSFSMLLGALARGERPDLVIFADVTDAGRKDPGEWPATYRHLREVVVPLCASKGIEFKWLTTEEEPIRGQRSLIAYFEHLNAMPGRISRMCTSAAKVERIFRFVERVVPEHVAINMWVGFEAGEENRSRPNGRDPHAQSNGRIRRRFPLQEWGMCRCRCVSYIREAGYQVPNGSACVFCPFSKWDDFTNLRDQLPEQFARVQAMEDNCKLTKAGKTIRFAGGADAPRLTDRLDKPYQRRVKRCEVCGADKHPKRTAAHYLEATA
jgi:hypothetical protein